MLIADIERYLTLRQSLGFKLERAAEYLEAFARFAAARGERHIRAQTAIEWAQRAPTPGSRYCRLRDVARAARFLHIEDPAHEVPPASFFARSRNKLIPYIFAPDDLVRLIEAAVELHRHEHYPVQRQRYAMLFGLIAATGLRISEALDLQLGDILPGGVLHIREAKFGKSRLVPLHATVRDALDRYLSSALRFCRTGGLPVPVGEGEKDHLPCGEQGLPRHHPVCRYRARAGPAAAHP